MCDDLRRVRIIFFEKRWKIDFIRIELPDGSSVCWNKYGRGKRAFPCHFSFISHPDGFYPNEIENGRRQKNEEKYSACSVFINKTKNAKISLFDHHFSLKDEKWSGLNGAARWCLCCISYSHHPWVSSLMLPLSYSAPFHGFHSIPSKIAIAEISLKIIVRTEFYP